MKKKYKTTRNEILRYNDAYICFFDAYYGVTHTTESGRETTRRKWTIKQQQQQQQDLIKIYPYAMFNV